MGIVLLVGSVLVIATIVTLTLRFNCRSNKNSTVDWGNSRVNLAARVDNLKDVEEERPTIDGDWLDGWYNNLDASDYVKFTVANASGDDSTQPFFAALRFVFASMLS